MGKRRIASAIMATTFLIAAGSAQAAGVGPVFTLPIGPTLRFKQGGAAVRVGGVEAQPKDVIESSEYRGEEAMETGNAPERKGVESDASVVENP